MALNQYTDMEAYEAASRPTDESEVALIQDTNEVEYNGVNVVTDEPMRGDIIANDADGVERYIMFGTYNADLFPSDWTITGVVGIRKGNGIYRISKDAASKRYLAVYPYIVTGFSTSGEEETVTITVNSKAYSVTHSATSAEEFAEAVNAVLEENSTDWSCYVHEPTGEVWLQNNGFITSSSTAYGKYASSSSVTLTSIVSAYMGSSVAETRVFLKNGYYGYPILNLERVKIYYLADLDSENTNPVSEVPLSYAYSVCWPAFSGTSELRGADYCTTLREAWCADPDNPTLEEWYTYLESREPILPIMYGAFGPDHYDGAEFCEKIKDLTYMATDGTYGYISPAASYAAEAFDGEGFIASPAQWKENCGDILYGNGSGVAAADSDVINKTLNAIGGTLISAASQEWLALRNSATGAWYYSTSGRGYTNNFRNASLVRPFSFKELATPAN